MINLEEGTAFEGAYCALLGAGISPRFPSWATHADEVGLLLDAVNAAAKVIDCSFYGHKEALMRYALSLKGIHAGMGVDEWGMDVVYMSTPNVGVVCFHDPYGKFQGLSSWNYAWSGFSRTPLALEVIQGDFELLEEVIQATAL